MPADRDRSLFEQIYAGPAGLDPYAAAVSDVYQDLFGEGSYTGKGIFDVDAFEAALAGRVPENALLSHDLFEGIFARAGLVTDIELFEEFPSNYEVAVVHRRRTGRERCSGPHLDSPYRPVENARQSSPYTFRAGGLSDFDCWLDAAVRCALDLDDIRTRMYRYPCPFTGIDRRDPASPGHFKTQSCA